MIYDFIAIGIIIICVGAITYVVAKKFPAIAAINLETITQHKQEHVKRELVADRLKRKLAAFDLRNLLQRARTDHATSPFGRFYHFLKDLERSYQQRIQAAEPVEQAETEKKIMILFEAAKTHSAAKQYKEAEAKYIEIISLDKKNIEAYQGLAEVYVELKDYTHAREIYQYLLKLNSADDATYEHLGRIASEEGDLHEAERDYLRSISLNAEVANYHVELGDIYRAMHDTKKAIASYRQAVQLEPNNPRNLNVLIEVAIEAKDKELARTYLKRLALANPDNEKLPDLEKEINLL